VGVVNSTFARNSSQDAGGGISVRSATLVSLENAIVWNNSFPQISLDSGTLDAG
jgi:predicted outer membrane repeat protein